MIIITIIRIAAVIADINAHLVGQISRKTQVNRANA